jgi:hypothetical protein
MRVYVYADPPIRAENFCHRDAIRIGNIITTTENDHAFSILQELLNNGCVRVVRSFQIATDHGIAEIKDLLPDVKGCQFIKLPPNCIRTLGCSYATTIPPYSLILWTTKDYDIGRSIMLSIRPNDITHSRVIWVVSRKKKLLLWPRCLFKYIDHDPIL